MAGLRANHGEAQWRVGWLLVRRVSPEIRRAQADGCLEQGVQGKTCPSESGPCGPRLRRIGRRWLVAVRTSCRAPGTNGRVPQAGSGRTRLADHVLFRRPRPKKG